MLAVPESGSPQATERLAGAADEPRADALEGVAAQLLRTLKLVQLAAHTAAKDTASGEVDMAAYRLLARLIIDGPARLTTLAEAMHSDSSTVSRQTSALVNAGLLERRPDAADGRACLLAATEAGHAAFRRYKRSRGERLARMLDGWPDEEVEQFACLLERFNGTFEDHYTESGQDSKAGDSRPRDHARGEYHQAHGEGEEPS